MIEAGRGGSMILTSSTAGIRVLHTMADYTTAKHGVVGLTRAFANEFGGGRGFQLEGLSAGRDGPPGSVSRLDVSLAATCPA